MMTATTFAVVPCLYHVYAVLAKRNFPSGNVPFLFLPPASAIEVIASEPSFCVLLISLHKQAIWTQEIKTFQVVKVSFCEHCIVYQGVADEYLKAFNLDLPIPYEDHLSPLVFSTLTGSLIILSPDKKS